MTQISNYLAAILRILCAIERFTFQIERIDFFPALLIAMVVFEDWLQIGLAANRRFAPPIRHTLSNSLIHYNNNVTFRLEK